MKETFEEKFPSLKTRWDKNVKKRIFYREEVQEHCLDKSQVKYVLDLLKKDKISIDNAYKELEIKNEMS